MLICFIIREMRIKTTRCDLTPVRRTIIKESTNNKLEREVEVEKRGPSYTVGGNIN